MTKQSGLIVELNASTDGKQSRQASQNGQFAFVENPNLCIRDNFYKNPHNNLKINSKIAVFLLPVAPFKTPVVNVVKLFTAVSYDFY